VYKVIVTGAEGKMRLRLRRLIL